MYLFTSNYNNSENMVSVNDRPAGIHGLESIDEESLQDLQLSFDNLPQDPYLAGGYRFRRFSRFEVDVDTGDITHLPPCEFKQNKVHNALLGNLKREYSELEDSLINSEAFAMIVQKFWSRKCSKHNTIGVHQIRITTSATQSGNPAPEGCHQDGVDFLGIMCINRHNIMGGETSIYPYEQQKVPVLTRTLKPGEMLLVDDREVFHYTSAIKPKNKSTNSYRDVFIFTCPDIPVDPTS